MSTVHPRCHARPESEGPPWAMARRGSRAAPVPGNPAFERHQGRRPELLHVAVGGSARETVTRPRRRPPASNPYEGRFLAAPVARPPTAAQPRGAEPHALGAPLRRTDDRAQLRTPADGRRPRWQEVRVGRRQSCSGRRDDLGRRPRMAASLRPTGDSAQAGTDRAGAGARCCVERRPAGRGRRAGGASGPDGPREGTKKGPPADRRAQIAALRGRFPSPGSGLGLARGRPGRSSGSASRPRQRRRRSRGTSCRP